MYCKDLETLKTNLLTIQENPKAESFLLFVADKNRPSPESLNDVLKLVKLPVIGGVFPEIIADGRREETGFLVIPLCYTLDTCLIDLSVDIQEIRSQINKHAQESNFQNPCIFCFTDALAPSKNQMIDLLYDAWGPQSNYVGGGAGSLSFKPFPCIINNNKIYENAAVIGLMDTTISVGVAHGWTPISDPIKVTETIGNTIVSLNWEPAFDVYKQLIKEHSGLSISVDNFFDIAKSYPLGLVRLDSEMIIRDPYATENNHLHIVDNVPEGEYIRIMNGNIESLLEGAVTAYNKASFDADSELTEQFCVDCISRVLYMQEEFSRELSLLNQDKPMNGILSIGEIANPGDAVLELFNKTIVAAKWIRKL